MEKQGFSFEKLAISPEIKKAVAEMGFINTTPIQEGTIPLIMAGKDVIGYSQTGTGKTAAFGIPAIEKIDPDKPKETQVLVLCPTRELAVQATEEIKKFAKYKKDIHTVCVYGGDSIERQIRELKRGAQIVIGTPGRIMDHMRRNTLKLQNLKMIILDEADEMLNIGFREDIETILRDIPEGKQTVLFSATMPPAIVAITKKFQNNPIMVRGQSHTQGLTVPAIEQIYYEAPIGHKEDVLCSILNLYDPKRSMIFCNTKKMVDELTENLQAKGYLAEGLHGDMRQTARSQVMNKFKNGKINILIATDVAARGIDVEDIEAVFNYDIPNDQEYYIHRIGRTGRAGKSGKAFTIVSGRRQVYALRDIQRFTKAQICQKPLPSSKEINQHQINKFVEMISEVLNHKKYQSYENIIDKLTEQGFELKDIAQSLLHLQLAGEIITEPLAYENLQYNNPKTKYAENRTKQFGRKNASAKNMTRLTINIGSKKGISPNHIVGAIAQATGLPGKIIGHIDIHPDYSLVDVDKHYEAQILSIMKKCKIKGIMTSTTPYKNK
ncbi:MAG: DEAD/DEAH box helicase [Clostridia bacterium]|nr:DEAD/DEAH box helicase [Clostridia bacterium]MDD4571122.1 DEAD/DEAH box helicase [Clostridia bacterium]